MSVHALCSQISSIVAVATDLKIQSGKFSLNFDQDRIQRLLQTESSLRRQIFQQTGIPAYQVCEYCEPAVSGK
jgi:hypothetical protein